MSIKSYTWQIVFILAFFLVSYGAYFLLEQDTAIQLSLEDDVFETLTALSFLGAAYFFFRSYRYTKNLYFVLLVIIFFIGAGEEISWGQRFFGFDTPESMAERNRQNEFNLHNIDIFHPQKEGGISKSGISKLLTIDFLYNIFWLSWCIIVPLLNYTNIFKNLFNKIRLPIPALPLGIFFLVNFFIFYLTRSYTSPDKSSLYYMRYREIFECCSSVIFLLIAHAFSTYTATKRVTA